MPEVSTVIDGNKYVLVPNADCDECAFINCPNICSMKKLDPRLKLNGAILCHMFYGVWKKASSFQKS